MPDSMMFTTNDGAIGREQIARDVYDHLYVDYIMNVSIRWSKQIRSMTFSMIAYK
jgi:hypothetical protein